jgi:hypothetical protein
MMTMTRTQKAVISAGVLGSCLGIFILLAQTHVIYAAYLTPIKLTVADLNTSYSTGQNATLTINVDGYGSNCHLLEVTTTNHDGEHVSYYKKADDCRFMEINHGPLNFAKSLTIDGRTLEKAGAYTVDITFEDLVDGGQAHTTTTFEVEQPKPAPREFSVNITESVPMQDSS